MIDQSEAAWGINEQVQKEYYKMYEARNNLHRLLGSLDYVCKGLKEPEVICKKAKEKCWALLEPIEELNKILAPFHRWGFRDKYNV